MARKLPRILKVDADRVADAMRRAEKGEMHDVVLDAWGAMLDAEKPVTAAERHVNTVAILMNAGTARVDYDPSVAGLRKEIDALAYG